MPVRKVVGGYKWGKSGKVYLAKAQAERQGRAAYASGYQDGGITEVSQGDDPSTVDRVRNFLSNIRFPSYYGESPPPETVYPRGIARGAAQLQQPEKPPLTAAQTAYLAAQLDPTMMTGLVDAGFGYPSFPAANVPLEEAFSGELMPSLAENVRGGNLGIAALQTLGLIPGIGMVTRGRRVARAASDVARASRSSETARIPALSAREIVAEAESKGVKLDISENKGVLNLSRIVVPEKNQGVGTAIMKDIADYADRTGQTITLTPSKGFGGSSVSRLKDFYRRFGFVENKGKNKNFEYRDTMYRSPDVRKK